MGVKARKEWVILESDIPKKFEEIFEWEQEGTYTCASPEDYRERAKEEEEEYGTIWGSLLREFADWLQLITNDPDDGPYILH